MAGVDPLAGVAGEAASQIVMAALTLSELGAGLDKKDFVKRALDTGRAEFLAGKITTAESLSRTNLESAVQWLLDQQVVIEKDKKLVPGPKPQPALADRIYDYL